MRLRHLRLRADTERGRFGFDLPVEPGLVILRADNSRGKSTAIQAILFALGLEKMVTSRAEHMVTSALRDHLIFDPETKEETAVHRSWVSVELEAGDGATATVTRWAKDDQMETGLLRVQSGPALTAPGQYATADYYAGRQGSAANPRGFHRWLASFLGWEMPELAAPDGRTVPLYLEQVFPLVFVEQRRGWGGIQAQMPYFSGASDVRRRATEFVLDLDVGRLERERQRLRQEELQLQAEWRRQVERLRASLDGRGLVVVGLPENAPPGWPPETEPYLAKASGPSWEDVASVRTALLAEASRLSTAPVPRVEQIASEAERRLDEVLAEEAALRKDEARLRADLARDSDAVQSVRARIAALEDDLRQHRDIVTLRALGSRQVEAIQGECPVCHQAIPSALLDLPATESHPLDPEAAVEFIQRQLKLFELTERDSVRTMAAKREQWAALRSTLVAIRAEARALQATVLSANDAPSTEAIARRLAVEGELQTLDAIGEAWIGTLGSLGAVAERMRRVRGAIAAMPQERLSEGDRAKLSLLQSSFVDQLQAYGFGSLSGERIVISRDDYLPRRDGFDVQAEVSASDLIRIVWAYLLGLLDVSEAFSINHPKLLIFDEPRQQSANKVSFAALLRRAASQPATTQTLFATSEEAASLRTMLRDLPHSLHLADGYLLKPVRD